MTADTLELRRRRAGWRASHRGTKELDIMIGRYADAVLPDLVDPSLALFEAFLIEPEPELQRWLLNGEPVTKSEYERLVADVRRHFGI